MAQYAVAPNEWNQELEKWFKSTQSTSHQLQQIEEKKKPEDRYIFSIGHNVNGWKRVSYKYLLGSAEGDVLKLFMEWWQNYVEADDAWYVFYAFCAVLVLFVLYILYI